MPNPYRPIPMVTEDAPISAADQNALRMQVNRNRVIPDPETMFYSFGDGGCTFGAIPPRLSYHARTTSAFSAAADDDHMASGTVMLRAANPTTGVLADTGISAPAWNKDTTTGGVASGVKCIVTYIDSAWVITWVQC